MYILQKKCESQIKYLKWDGWEGFPYKGPLNLTGCILFTKGEVELNPPKHNEEYQHWGCYAIPYRRVL